jgi:AhpD family alkylhydroperoxidase
MRVDYVQVLPAAREAMVGLDKVVARSSLEPELVELVRLRASQLNGCAFCLDMHSKDARARGEDEQRLHVLAGWREAPFYSPRERAALAWCEDLTLLPETGAPDGAYAPLEEHFSPEEIVALTLAVVAINGWNRLAVGLRKPVGDYVSRLRPRARAALS